MIAFDHPRDLLKTTPALLGTSDWITVDQERINGFADATDDHQWIHTDPERAAAGPFGTTVAHGYLTLSLAPRMLAEAVRVEHVSAAVNYGVDKVRFSSPVPINSRVRGHVSLVAASTRADMVEVVFGLTVERVGSDRPARIAELVVLHT